MPAAGNFDLALRPIAGFQVSAWMQTSRNGIPQPAWRNLRYPKELSPARLVSGFAPLIFFLSWICGSPALERRPLIRRDISMTFSVKKIAGIAALVLSGAGSMPAFAASPTQTVQLISETGAQQVIRAAEQEAQKLHAPCAIAVVDTSGTLVAFVKMDGVRDGSPDLAIDKARTSALLQRPSEETENNINQGRYAFITAGFTALRGGMPLTVNGEVVGAVGVASLNKDNDVTISQAAAKEFASTAGTEPAEPDASGK
jgi:glc operon protein GlcG